MIVVCEREREKSDIQNVVKNADDGLPLIISLPTNKSPVWGSQHARQLPIFFLPMPFFELDRGFTIKKGLSNCPLVSLRSRLRNMWSGNRPYQGVWWRSALEKVPSFVCITQLGLQQAFGYDVTRGGMKGRERGGL